VNDKGLTLGSLSDAIAETLASSETILALAAETQKQGAWRVFQLFDYSPDNESVSTPSAIVLPMADDDVSSTLKIGVDVRIRESRVLQQSGTENLVKHQAASTVAQWVETSKDVLYARLASTDANFCSIATNIDYASFARLGIVVIGFDVTVKLSKSINRKSYI